VGRDPAQIVKTRLGTLIVSPTHEEAERRRRTYQSSKGFSDEEVSVRLIWGDPDDVGEAVQPFFDAGLDGLIFNMPVGSTPDDVALAGTTLVERFGPGAAPHE
jgi:alkanesulfonate monooxygenase SsuD/methylene tetrahydromethanopterin reductase-like flavin-dependent oxidoreductase (luciferase family)